MPKPNKSSGKIIFCAFKARGFVLAWTINFGMSNEWMPDCRYSAINPNSAIKAPMLKYSVIWKVA